MATIESINPASCSCSSHTTGAINLHLCPAPALFPSIDPRLDHVPFPYVLTHWELGSLPYTLLAARGGNTALPSTYYLRPI